jgi:hypothetical protein
VIPLEPKFFVVSVAHGETRAHETPIDDSRIRKANLSIVRKAEVRRFRSIGWTTGPHLAASPAHPPPSRRDRNATLIPLE